MEREVAARLEDFADYAMRTLGSRLRSLLLTGSAAQNAMTLSRAGGILSDLDMVLVLTPSHPLRRIIEIPRVAAEVSKYLSMYGRQPHTSVWVVDDRAASWSAWSPMILELATTGRLLAGEHPATLPSIIGGAQLLPPWEGVRLLLNRITELVVAAGATDYKDDAIDSLEYVAVKSLVACADAELILRRTWVPTYLGRRAEYGRRANPLAASTSEEELIMWAYDRKLNLTEPTKAESVIGLYFMALDTIRRRVMTIGNGSLNDVLARAPATNSLAARLYFSFRAGRLLPAPSILAIYERALDYSESLSELRNTTDMPRALRKALCDLQQKFRDAPQIVGDTRRTAGES